MRPVYADDDPPAPPPAHTNLSDLVAGHAQREPQRTALVAPEPNRRALSWGEVEAAVAAVAAGLAARGLVAGHRVALSGANSIEYVLAYLGVLRAGFVAVPLNPRLTDVEFIATLTDSGARVVLSDHPRPTGSVDRLELSAPGLAELTAHGRRDVATPRDPESLAVLLYTAGTSAGPKAAMLSHRALLAHLEHVGQTGLISADAVMLAALPLFHVFGLNGVLGSWLWSGARLVVSDGLPADLTAVVAAEQVTDLPVAPAMLRQLLDEGLGELGSVRTVLSGAAPLGDDVRAAFAARTGLAVQQGYGLTEAGPGVTVTTGEPAHGGGHVGRPLPGVEVRIDDAGKPGEPGEIWIRGDNLFSGYWPTGEGGPDADGWFATGDVGYLDGGELYLIDRSRELVIVNGFNVYPAEVEAAIAELPGVRDVAVIGRPDPRTGEQVVAFVAGEGITAEAVREFCATRLARFKCPQQVEVLTELPRGATGKIRKGELRQRLIDGAG